ncbi:hypothetical protein [Ureibacillus acetophenoni]|uniref:Uncharacterized protein n=1 Tax=Ureibacillus acetophenoni TaxID=614649 RepID=A0A285UEN0_9BACL|nr:hypothetical protein [Ureibacillus acetophenoni]SOC39036.1 hypothetical protein SAMN05877842_10515 [Ureibacillus acetophenoni]
MSRYNDWDGKHKHECGCNGDKKHHDKLDDLLDLLKKLLKDKENDKQPKSCQSVFASFDTSSGRLIAVTPNGAAFGCAFVPGQQNDPAAPTIAQLTACLYSNGFKIVADGFSQPNGISSVIFVRCN